VCEKPVMPVLGHGCNRIRAGATKHSTEITERFKYDVTSYKTTIMAVVAVRGLINRSVKCPQWRFLRALLHKHT